MSNRKVGFNTILPLLKQRSILLIGALALFIGSIFVFIFISSVQNSLSEPFEKYNQEEINKNGKETTAKITYIREKKNVSINEEHPIVISYEYNVNGKIVKDKFETLDLEKANGFKEGTDIKVLYFNSQSVIKGLDPFKFPSYIFLIVPLMMFGAFCIMLLVAILPALSILRIYRQGIVKEAEIASIMPQFGSGAGKQKVSVGYVFKDEFGNKIFGQAVSNDLAGFMTKKAGDTINILVMPNNYKKSCLIPESLLHEIV